MHFTVLTAVTLPENCGQAINLPATVRINELVAALRRARFGDNAAKDALDSELVETQVRFEQMVEDLVDNRLLPYCENIEDRAYLEFVDCTEECRREYENDGEVMVRLVNGTWLPMLEPIAAHFYAQRTGNTVTDDNYLYQHATLEYALANIDRRYTRKEDGEGGVLECKSLTYHKAADWADGAIPIYYELQLRYYLAVLDEKHGAFSALWGNNPENDLATPHIERVQAKEDIIFEKLDRWIWSLRHDKPPTMEDVQPQLAMDALARIYGAGKKGLPTIEFPRKYEPQLRKIAALQEENAQLKGAIKKNEEAIEAHSVRIAELMKEHEHGILTTTTDKLLVDFVTSTSRRVSSDYLKQNYPTIYEEARKPSKNRKVKVTIQPL